MSKKRGIDYFTIDKEDLELILTNFEVMRLWNSTTIYDVAEFRKIMKETLTLLKESTGYEEGR